MSDMVLCRLDTVPDGGGLMTAMPGTDRSERLVVVRRGGQAWAYENRCPHFSVGLDYEPDKVLTYGGQVLMCAHHSALFRFEDGYCIEGPCEGARLTTVEIQVVDNEVRCAARPDGKNGG